LSSGQPVDRTAHATRDGLLLGARRSIPLSVAVGGFGVSYGVLAKAAGFGTFAPIVMSMTTFGGSAQFAAISVIGAGGSVATAVLAAILLNARYGPIGLSVAPSIRGNVFQRFAQAQLVIDESWALAHEGGGRFDRDILMGAGIALFFSWQIGTVIGVIGGDAFGDPKRFGLDAAFPALFLALLMGQLRSRRAVAVALLGAGIALVLVPVARPGVPIVAAASACLLGWRRR
jgi:4-azaleucine resistance transporter AzlC